MHLYKLKGYETTRLYMKRCATCKIEKSSSSFYKNKSKKDGRQYSCKNCQNIYHNKIWYKKRRDSRKQQVLTRKQENRRINFRRVLHNYFSKGCVDCGEKDFRCLEFDHVRGIKKKVRGSSGVGQFVRDGYKWETVLKEINKCEVRCASCHKIKTFKQLNYMKDMKDIIQEHKNKMELNK